MRTLLDHYAFGENDPAARIPPARHGLLDTIPPGQTEAVRGTIKRYL